MAATDMEKAIEAAGAFIGGGLLLGGGAIGAAIGDGLAGSATISEQTACKSAMADARHEAAQLRAQAEEQRREIVEGASTEAEARAAGIVSRSQARLVAERRQAVRQLKAELGNLAVELTEKILGEALADDQRQKRLIDRFLSHIEEEANAG
jgi:F0F1-type ATP synthase membrane subunit b/b'